MFHQCSRGLEDTNTEGRHNVLHNRMLLKLEPMQTELIFHHRLCKSFWEFLKKKHIRDLKPSRQLLTSPTMWREVIIKRHQNIEGIIWFYKLRLSVTAKVCWRDFQSQLDYATQQQKKMLHCEKARVFSKQRHSNFDLPMLRRDWTRLTSLKIAEISLKGLLIFTVQVTASPCIFMTHGDTYFSLHSLMRPDIKLFLVHFWATFLLTHTEQ